MQQCYPTWYTLRIRRYFYWRSGNKCILASSTWSSSHVVCVVITIRSTLYKLWYVTYIYIVYVAFGPHVVSKPFVVREIETRSEKNILRIESYHANSDNILDIWKSKKQWAIGVESCFKNITRIKSQRKKKQLCLFMNVNADS